MTQQALIVIDVQNDYFAGGLFPLWNTEAVLEQTLRAVSHAKSQGIPVLLVQHIADTSQGKAPFFNPDSDGVAIHPRLLAIVPDAPVIIKQAADSFWETGLEQHLRRLNISKITLCGMMTHNCVTHTALSRSADAYEVDILSDACTTVSEILHLIALSAIGNRIPLASTDDWIAAV